MLSSLGKLIPSRRRQTPGRPFLIESIFDRQASTREDYIAEAQKSPFQVNCASLIASGGESCMWKPEHRRAAMRRGLRYESDLTDAEWALVAPLIRPARRGGRPRRVDVREVLNAILYVLWTGCQWKALPKDLPPRSTVGLPRPLGAGRYADAHPPCALCRGPRGGWPGGQPHRCYHRQPERQGRAKDPMGHRTAERWLGSRSGPLRPGGPPWTSPLPRHRLLARRLRRCSSRWS